VLGITRLHYHPLDGHSNGRVSGRARRYLRNSAEGSSFDALPGVSLVWDFSGSSIGESSQDSSTSDKGASLACEATRMWVASCYGCSARWPAGSPGRP
jgi:hypothetical protein